MYGGGCMGGIVWGGGGARGSFWDCSVPIHPPVPENDYEIDYVYK